MVKRIFMLLELSQIWKLLRKPKKKKNVYYTLCYYSVQKKSSIVGKTHLLCHVGIFWDLFHMKMMSILSFHSFHEHQ